MTEGQAVLALIFFLDFAIFLWLILLLGFIILLFGLVIFFTKFAIVLAGFVILISGFFFRVRLGTICCFVLGLDLKWLQNGFPGRIENGLLEATPVLLEIGDGFLHGLHADRCRIQLRPPLFGAKLDLRIWEWQPFTQEHTND